MSPEPVDTSRIAGNAPDEVKQLIGNLMFIFSGHRKGLFSSSIVNRMVVTEVSIIEKSEEPLKKEGRVVCELETKEDMLNGGGAIHGGCSAFLIDICSTLAIMTLSMANTGGPLDTVSQSLNIVYHSPAVSGDKLRIVNSTMTLGARAVSARTEIWNDTHRRLVASGTHVKMQPSKPKASL
ncbi:hypothetical protein AMATHDRAFT_154507 [Amanita thiersii Skay4041]|uniref:Thioesterase domain-containing protein n=1 Tax=Amanita thiersii Skay4041 TaxID=703135 RepID=A0A2A9N7R5_9AGAR|nr:hypothetical protein AMATHDRAFT_154507 [Amanita thiersii Skay4041]